MTRTYTYLAMDFGASSGRAEVVRLKDGRVEMEEIHRFDNRPVRLNGSLYWDFPFLFAEIVASIRLCQEKGIELDSMAVDTWGVDFGLLDENGQLIANPMHYRDNRTTGIHDYSDAIMTRSEIFNETGCEPWAISSLFQLLTLKRDNSSLLPIARTFLQIPDLFNYFLSGIAKSEKSIVSTGNLMSAQGTWSKEVVDRFDLPDLFQDLIEPGTVLGDILPEIKQQTGWQGELPVVATCGHDTAAVAVAVPVAADEQDWAFISCGTWSVLGMTREDALTNDNVLAEGFSNEYTLGGWFICANIVGLWIVQELRRKWDTVNEAWDYFAIEKSAITSTYKGLIDMTDECFMAPDDMEQTVVDYLLNSGQPKPESRGDIVNAVYQSLALEYAVRLEKLSQLNGRDLSKLYLVGGGAQSNLLCQYTANACQLDVQAGVDQCTSLGNALTQAVGMGHLKDVSAAREVARRSFELTTKVPENSGLWTSLLTNYKKLQKEK